jgi:hypothetical protein
MSESFSKIQVKQEATLCPSDEQSPSARVSTVTFKSEKGDFHTELAISSVCLKFQDGIFFSDPH